MKQFEFTVEEQFENQRIDKYLGAVVEDYSRSFLQKLFDSEKVLVNGKPVNKKHKVQTGQTVLVEVTLPQQEIFEPENIPLDIVFEDEHLLVVNKPKGMTVHPGAGTGSGTLVNALLYHFQNLSDISGAERPGIVHRIDKDTSGLLVVAKTNIAHIGLAEQLKEHSMVREYRAVAHGVFKEPEGTVDAPIGRHPKERIKMAVTEKNSRNAVTHYKVLHQFEEFAYLKLQLETGRTHQIRVHMCYMHRPLAGDEVYGPKKAVKGLQGQCLHAKTLGFIHPVTGEKLLFESELPEYFTRFLKKLGAGEDILSL